MNDSNVPATRAFSGTYVVDRDHSSLQFAVEHMQLSSFRASFEDVHGRLAADADGISIEGSAPVQSISIKAPPALRDQVIRGFFLGDDHPEVIFRSTEVELGDDAREGDRRADDARRRMHNHRRGEVPAANRGPLAASRLH